jgi:non-ribosomal peptide synthetase component E (peptide arylation enzyme)
MTDIGPGATVGFIGLGRMGAPMATRLAQVGYPVQGHDVSEAAARIWAERVPAPPDAELGERICVSVVPQPGTRITLDAIRDGVAAARVARFKRPELHEVVAELPVTKVGKLDKKALREMLAGRSTG